PIIPGLKIVNSKRNLSSIPRNFFVDLPPELADEVAAADPEHVLDIGVEWAHRQTVELLEKGVRSVHFYVLSSSKAVQRLMAKLDV
ncbi:MAG: methylenetetrahydrofolate reductase, partial [Acidobacteria bacterium]|nr:methylenetetrahydrofolate reductase [Acidobacteriota bacterium]